MNLGQLSTTKNMTPEIYMLSMNIRQKHLKKYSKDIVYLFLTEHIVLIIINIYLSDHVSRNKKSEKLIYF